MNARPGSARTEVGGYADLRIELTSRLGFGTLVEPTFDPPFPNHTIMHGANRFGLASLTNLDQLPPTGAVVIAPPLKIVNGSGSPLRVLALVPV